MKIGEMSMGILNILNLVGGLALFLYGMNSMSEAIYLSKNDL